MILVDTTETFRDLRLVKLDWMQLLALCSAGAVELHVPHAVFEETVRHHEIQVLDTRAAVKSKLETLAKLGVPVLSEAFEEPYASTFEDYLVGRLETVGAVLMPPPDVSVSQLLERDLQKRKPFAENGKGMRDALNWHSVLELAASCDDADHVVWVTGNWRDFATSAEGDLHPHLLADLSDVSANVSRSSSIRKLLDGPLLSELVSDLETTPQALEHTLHLAAMLEDVKEPTPDEIVSQALGDLAASVAEEDLEVDPFGLGGIALPEGAEVLESVVISQLELDTPTLSWQAYDTFDETTWMISGSVFADVEISGYVHKSDASLLPPGIALDGWDGEEHYLQVSWSFYGEVTFQIRLELGVGVDSLEIESISGPQGA